MNLGPWQQALLLVAVMGIGLVLILVIGRNDILEPSDDEQEDN